MRYHVTYKANPHNPFASFVIRSDAQLFLGALGLSDALRVGEDISLLTIIDTEEN